MRLRSISFTLIFVLYLVFGFDAEAQTSTFNYQGRLTDGGNPANGTFQMQFKLFDAVSAGTQIGSTLNDVPVTAANGVFAVKLDFGSAALSGANRWIEIAVRRTAAESYVTLAPREQLVSSPYAVKSISADTATNATNATTAANATNLGGLPASRYVQTDASGNVGIGASPAAGSKLTVGGRLEVTSGGIKFPDATVQNTAGLPSVVTSGPLTGNGTTASPLGITSPVSTRDLDSPFRQPVMVTVNTDTTVMYTVPAGKVLVVQHFSAEKVTTTTAPLPWLWLFSSGQGSMTIPPETWSDNSATRTYLFNRAITLYAYPGTQIAILPGQNGQTSTGFRANFVGYLVDLP